MLFGNLDYTNTDYCYLSHNDNNAFIYFQHKNLKTKFFEFQNKTCVQISYLVEGRGRRAWGCVARRGGGLEPGEDMGD